MNFCQDYINDTRDLLKGEFDKHPILCAAIWALVEKCQALEKKVDENYRMHQKCIQELH
jgi:hypothetical protein